MWGTVSQPKYLPLITVCWLMVTFAASYLTAVSLKHVYPVWPYISDTGALPPESCIFGQMLNIGALLMGLIFYSRYRQVKIIVSKMDKRLKYLNMVCCVAGLAAALGASIVANFQETSNMTMHLFGANLIFGVGCFYFVAQTILSFFTCDNTFSKRLNVFRAVVCVLLIVSFANTMIFARKSLRNFKGGVKEAMHFNPDDPDYVFRLASTFSEWALAVCLGAYLLTFMHDFKHLDFSLSFTDDRFHPKGDSMAKLNAEA